MLLALSILLIYKYILAIPAWRTSKEYNNYERQPAYIAFYMSSSISRNIITDKTTLPWARRHLR